MTVVLVRDKPEKGFSSTEVTVTKTVVNDYLKRGWKEKKSTSGEQKDTNKVENDTTPKNTEVNGTNPIKTKKN